MHEERHTAVSTPHVTVGGGDFARGLQTPCLFVRVTWSNHSISSDVYMGVSVVE
jgi:hypothetical protein